MGRDAPHGIVGQAKDLLIPQHLPGTVTVKRSALQKALKVQAIAERLSGQLPGQGIHPVVAQQNVPFRTEEQ